MPRIKEITSKQIHADHWENHEGVVIRSLNTEDEEYITDGLADINAAGQPQMHAGRNKRLTLQRAIVSWTFTDNHGRPLPLSEQSIKELHPTDSQYIFDQIQAHNKPMTVEEKKDVTPSVSDSTEKAASPRKQR